MKGIAPPRRFSGTAGSKACLLSLILLIILILAGGCRPLQLKATDPDAYPVFPRDHGGHNDAQWEWWYFNGRIENRAGEKYDYFLAFFKADVENDTFLMIPVRYVTPFAPQYFPFQFGGCSIFDHQNKTYSQKHQNIFPFFWQGSFSEQGMNIRLGKNRAWRNTDDTFHVELQIKDYSLTLHLSSDRKPLLYGKKQNGVLEFPEATHRYYSCTRLDAAGTITVKGKSEQVTGTSWMDHQYGFIDNTDFQGWDWICANLDNGVDIIFAYVRYYWGGVVPRSFCAIMHPDGRTEYLEADRFRIRPTRTWKSPKTRVTYGIDWEMEVPEMGIKLRSKASRDRQEMKIPPVTFWTGSCDITGAFNNHPVTGRGFLETWGDYRAPFRNMYRSGMDVSR